MTSPDFPTEQRAHPPEVGPLLPTTGLRVCLVLWSGAYGGAETATVTLARHLVSLGTQVGILFVCQPGPLAKKLAASKLPWASLHCPRGSYVLLHLYRFTRTVRRLGQDGAILQTSGFLAAALRTAGFRSRIVAVEHGEILQWPLMSPLKRLWRTCERACASHFIDVQVAVSKCVLSALSRAPHPRRCVHIPNGIDLAEFFPATGHRCDRSRPLVVGCACRQVAGKGVEDLLNALALLRIDPPPVLELAGDGPERPKLEALARALGVRERVRFRGWTDDMPAFWRRCDLAVVPTNVLAESFSMAALEAMASGVPVVAARAGGLPELVRHGRTGYLFSPGQPQEIARALERYAVDLSLLREHGLEARHVAEREYDARAWAAAYARLFR